MTARDHLQEMLYERFTNKKSIQEIANIYGISRERVRQLIGNTGKIFRTSLREEQEIYAQENPHLTTAEIAKHFNIGENHAGRIWKGKRHAISGNSGAFKGHKGEEEVSQMLSDLGFFCELQNYGSPFDLLINGVVKAEIKSVYKKKTSPSIKNVSPAYHFKTKNGKCADLFIFFIEKTKDIFIVPRYLVTQSDIVFAWPTLRPEIGKYQKFHNRFDIIWSLIKERT